MPSSDRPPNSRMGTDSGPSQSLCAMAKPASAAVAAMHKVRTMKRGLKGQQERAHEILAAIVAAAIGTCAPPKETKMLCND